MEINPIRVTVEQNDGTKWAQDLKGHSVIAIRIKDPGEGHLIADYYLHIASHIEGLAMLEALIEVCKDLKAEFIDNRKPIS